MSRRIALLGAGILTGTVMIALFMLPFFNDAQANEMPVIPTGAPRETGPTEEQLNDYEDELAAHEADLQNQLSQRKEAIKVLDDNYEVQFTILEDQLDDINTQLSAASERVTVLKTETDKIQGEITAADDAFQEEMLGLQNSLSYQDSQIRQEIESVNAQLQQTYDQIAAKEASAMSGSGSSDSNGGNHDSDHHDDDDHDDDDHDDD
jgi:chromosome segregation ATPase